MHPVSFGASKTSLPPHEIVFGRSERMISIQRKLEVIGRSKLPVLITGENGTGKEVLARMMHSQSGSGILPFEKVNCPALPSALLETELFGYAPGAFTGANATKPGRVEAANRGTLFLDEIADMEIGAQAKLLQLLQDGEFCRIGAIEPRRVDIRVICATNRDLDAEVKAGTFRGDLYFRINVVRIAVPPLRERTEDIPSLVDYFLDHYARTFSTRTLRIPHDLMLLLQRYSWPGNIRQLENVIKRYVIFGSEESITSELSSQNTALSESCTPHFDGTTSLKQLTRDAVRHWEHRIIRKVLNDNRGNRAETARVLKISYRALLYKIGEAGISRKRKMPLEMCPEDVIESA